MSERAAYKAGTIIIPIFRHAKLSGQSMGRTRYKARQSVSTDSLPDVYWYHLYIRWVLFYFYSLLALGIELP